MSEGMGKIIKQITKRFGYNPFEIGEDKFLKYLNSQVNCRCTEIPPLSSYPVKIRKKKKALYLKAYKYLMRKYKGGMNG